jgi:hypothetical protein
MQDPEESTTEESQSGNASDQGISPVISHPEVSVSTDSNGNPSVSIGGSDFSVVVSSPPPPEESEEEETWSFSRSGSFISGSEIVESWSWTSSTTGQSDSANVVISSSGTIWTSGTDSNHSGPGSVLVLNSDGSWSSQPTPSSPPPEEDDDSE